MMRSNRESQIISAVEMGLDEVLAAEARDLS